MCFDLQANEELRQKLSSPHPQRSPTNLVQEAAIHQRVSNSSIEQQGHQWAESSQEEPGHQWAEPSRDEPAGRQNVDSVYQDREPVESCQDLLTQRLAPSGEGVESSREQLVQQWVEPSSDNDHLKYYPPVKSHE